MSVDESAARLAEDLEVDEARDVVAWRTPDGERVETGLHDYAALYAVPGLYEAVYERRLGGRSAQALAEALVAQVPDPAGIQVLDVGAGTGSVGAALWAAGFRHIAGVDIEPASEAAIARDRGDVYEVVRTMDLARPGAPDRLWLRAVAPDVITVAAAVGFGHVPAAAFITLTELLYPGALLAVTVARGYEDEPELAEHAALFGGEAFNERARVDAVHRLREDGSALEITVLVLERTGGLRP